MKERPLAFVILSEAKNLRSQPGTMFSILDSSLRSVLYQQSNDVYEVPSRLCHSERSEESLRGRWCLDPGIILPVVILHCVQNDKVNVALLYPTILLVEYSE
jgi:hypothetical protein